MINKKYKNIIKFCKEVPYVDINKMELKYEDEWYRIYYNDKYVNGWMIDYIFTDKDYFNALRYYLIKYLIKRKIIKLTSKLTKQNNYKEE